MAIILKKKSQDMTPRQEAALDAVGLGTGKITIKKKITSFEVGGKVRVVNSLFFWRKDYKVGDVGTVLRRTTAPVTPYTVSPRDDLYEVELDVEREAGRKVVIFSLWELDHAVQS